MIVSEACADIQTDWTWLKDVFIKLYRLMGYYALTGDAVLCGHKEVIELYVLRLKVVLDKDCRDVFILIT